MGGKGRIAHFTGFLVDPNTKLRMDNVVKAVAETNGAVTLIQTIADIDAPEPAQDKINAFLAAQGSRSTASSPPPGSRPWSPSEALRKIGDKRIKMVGIDHDPVVLKAIKDGYVDGTMLQNPYGQGYIGTYVMAKLAAGCKVKAGRALGEAPRRPRGSSTAAPRSPVRRMSDHYLDTMRAVTKTILADFQQKYLTCP